MLQPIQGAVNRKFRPSSYNRNDSKAKDTIISYLKNLGHTIVSTKEDYSFDITSHMEDTSYFSEVEMKNQWTGDWNTTWEEIRIPYRKHKLINRLHALNTTQEGTRYLDFYIIRRDCKAAWKINSSLLETCEVKEAWGGRILKGEQFFHVPYTEAELITLTTTQEV